MNRTLYLHIGTEKTGTTFLQAVLFRNRELLHSQGFHFLQCAGEKNNRALPAICIDEEENDEYLKQIGICSFEQKLEFRAKLERELDEELTSLPDSIHSVIISSEHFHSRTNTPSEIQRVHDLLSPYFSDIKIICYLREQAETFASLYSTVIKGGTTIADAFDRQMAKCNPWNHYYNYYAMLCKWSTVFGKERLHVRRFRKADFVNNDLVDDFFSILDNNLATLLDRDIEVVNESLDYVGQIVGLAINQSVPKFTQGGRENPVRKRTFDTLYQAFKGKGRTLASGQYKEVYESFHESNVQLNQVFFGSSENFFEYQEPAEASVSGLDDSVVEKLAQVISEITRSTIGFNEEHAYFLRDLAMEYEGKDILKAYQLMELAAMIRPQGSFVRKKLEEYRMLQLNAEPVDEPVSERPGMGHRLLGIFRRR